jgi:hypothetical protein
MREVLNWFFNIDVKWQLAIAILVVALLNPIFEPMTRETGEVSQGVDHRALSASFAKDYAPVINRLRDQSIWIEKKQIIPVIVEKTLSAEDLALLAAQAFENESWTLIGLIQSGDEKRAVLKRAGEYARDIKEGDELSSGERIVSINQDTILLALPDGERQLVLYPVN